MTVFDGFLLGLVQALGEFLPISSSAHLVLVPYFCGKVDPGLTFDVLLHAGTLLAVLIYFAKDWFVLTKQGLTAPKTQDGRMFWYLVAATLPAAIAGLVLEDLAEKALRHPLIIAGTLIVFGGLLWFADHKGKEGQMQIPTLKIMLLIGFAQILALVPGVSRSGITITAALLLGLSRPQSARISFLLSTPIIAGATLLKITKLSLTDVNMPLIAGVLTAFIGALAIIAWLMKYIKTHSFDIFVYYRWVLGAVIITFYFWK
jgi:undecaprenyl-diphosphatase